MTLTMRSKERIETAEGQESYSEKPFQSSGAIRHPCTAAAGCISTGEGRASYSKSVSIKVAGTIGECWFNSRRKVGNCLLCMHSSGAGKALESWIKDKLIWSFQLASMTPTVNIISVVYHFSSLQTQSRKFLTFHYNHNGTQKNI